MSKFNDDATPRKSHKNNRKMREIEFININLTVTDKSEIKQLKSSLAMDGIDALEQMVLGGYKVTISADYDNDCYMVSTTGGERTLNEDKCTTSRSDDIAEAVTIAYYKIFVLNGGKGWESKPRQFNWG